MKYTFNVSIELNLGAFLKYEIATYAGNESAARDQVEYILNQITCKSVFYDLKE